MKTGVKYTVEIDKNVVSLAGQALITEYLYNSDIPILRLGYTSWSWEWMVEQGTYRGKLPKRIARMLNRAYKIKITSEQMSDIGNIAKGHLLPSPTYTLDFNESLNWSAGDFGDRGSCFWTCHKLARDELRKHGVLAIRLYDEENKGYARAWVYEIDQDTWVLFNAYEVTTQRMANIFAEFLAGETEKSWEYCGICLSVDNDDRGLIYINANPQVIFVKGAIPPDEIGLEWDLGEYVMCYYCEAFAEEGHDYRGETYCQVCYDEETVQCVDCGDVIENAMDEFVCDEGALCSLCHDDRESSEV